MWCARDGSTSCYETPGTLSSIRHLPLSRRAVLAKWNEFLIDQNKERATDIFFEQKPGKLGNVVRGKFPNSPVCAIFALLVSMKIVFFTQEFRCDDLVRVAVWLDENRALVATAHCLLLCGYVLPPLLYHKIK